MTSRRRPSSDLTVSIFPGQIRIGDRFMDADTEDAKHEWEVISWPVTFKNGHARAFNGPVILGRPGRSTGRRTRRSLCEGDDTAAHELL